MAELVNLSQVKHGIYTHLAQLMSACWKYWDIPVPNALFERKEIESRREKERVNTSIMGWWGPAKGVPLMVFLAAEVTIPNMEKTNRQTLALALKRMQEVVQTRVKNIFRAFHLIPLTEGGQSRESVEVRSLFTLPTTTQPFVHIIPATPFAAISNFSDATVLKSLYTFERPISISAWLRDNDSGDYSDSNNRRRDTTKAPTIESTLDDCANKNLRNFVAHWIRSATNRHPMVLQQIATSNQRKDARHPHHIPLPSGIQFGSALLLLKSLLYEIPKQSENMDEHDFRKAIIAQSPGARGMIQQIEVILRKKVRDTVEIERVFSRSHSQEIMRKCIETYLQDSPPCYTRQYHLWKRDNAMRLFTSLSRGLCATEFAVRLEKECDMIWKQGRQSCEKTSLTGKVCRLKAGHENADIDEGTKHTREMDSTKHSSGCSFFHACTCGKSQKLREDPFTVEDANINFYERFTCCMDDGHLAIDLQKSTLGGNQLLVRDDKRIPRFDTALLYLSPASSYRNSVGLDKYEGFMNNTNCLLPWVLATDVDKKKKTGAEQDRRLVATAAAPPPRTEVSKQSMDVNEWPLPGTNKPDVKAKSPAPLLTNLGAFPALGATTAEPTGTVVPTETKAHNEHGMTKRERRRRDGKRKEREHRLEGQVRGYVGAEYECPLGHRFLSCGEGRVCKIGHKGHPKEHGNYFVHQDLPLYVMCPCSYANQKTTSEVTAQLQRLYIVSPDSSTISLSLKPRVKIVDHRGEVFELDLGFKEALTLPTNSVHVLRLPNVYSTPSGEPIPMAVDIDKRLSCGILEKECFQFHENENC
ncbi:hypothetical protein BX666DRAFT_1870497 [Dichotomocladium elegans]|nr:hypothetical protein BX666DRAFT_1870497 [Dichotomocladium elegans]